MSHVNYPGYPQGAIRSREQLTDDLPVWEVYGFSDGEPRAYKFVGFEGDGGEDDFFGLLDETGWRSNRSVLDRSIGLRNRYNDNFLFDNEIDAIAFADWCRENLSVRRYA